MCCLKFFFRDVLDSDNIENGYNSNLIIISWIVAMIVIFANKHIYIYTSCN